MTCTVRVISFKYTSVTKNSCCEGLTLLMNHLIVYVAMGVMMKVPM